MDSELRAMAALLGRSDGDDVDDDVAVTDDEAASASLRTTDAETAQFAGQNMNSSFSNGSSKHASSKKPKKPKKSKRSHRDSNSRGAISVETSPAPLRTGTSLSNQSAKRDSVASAEAQKAPARPLAICFAEPVASSLKCPLHGGLFRAPVLAQCGHTFCVGCMWLLVYGSHRSASRCPVDAHDFGMDGGSADRPAEFQIGAAAPPAVASQLRCFPNLVVSESVRAVKIFCPHGLRAASDSDPPEARLPSDKHAGDGNAAASGAWVRDPDGCQEVIAIGEMDDHMATCPFALVPCPHNATCEPIRRQDVEAHARTCSRKPCPFRSFGCSFEGDPTQVQVHIDGGDDVTRACIVAPVAPFLERAREAQLRLEGKVSVLETANQQLASQLRRQQEEADEQNLRQASRLNELEAAVAGLARELRGLLALESSDPGSAASSRRPSNADVHNGTHEARRSSSHRGIKDKAAAGVRDSTDRNGSEARLHAVGEISQRPSGRNSPQHADSRSRLQKKIDRAGHDASGSFVDAQNAKQEVNKEIQSRSPVNAIEEVGGSVAAAVANAPAPAGVAPVNMNCIGTYTGHGNVVWALCTEPTRGLLFSASSDRNIRVWDVAHSKCIHVMTGHEDIVHALTVFSPEGDDRKYLCSGSSDKTVRLWDIRPRKKDDRRGMEFECIGVIKKHDKTICSLACLSSAALLFTGTYMEVRIFDLDSEEEIVVPIQTLTGYKHWVRALAVSEPDGWLYSASFNVIHVWNVKKLPAKKVLSPLTGEGGSIYSLAVAPEKRKLFSGTYENVINIWNMDTHDLIQQLPGHIGAVYSLCVMPEMRRFYSGSYDSTIKVWNIDNFKPLQTLVRHGSTVTSLATMGGCLFSASADQTVKVWR